MTDSPWPQQRRAAVSLTFDDAKPSHPALVAPMLADLGIAGTFYTPIYSPLLRSINEWKIVVDAGHEIGNHSIFQPCPKQPERGWPDDAYNLRHYSRKRFRDEILCANEVLAVIDGVEPDGRQRRTYGNTCHCNTIGDGDATIHVDETISDLVLAARGEVRAEPIQFTQAQRMNLGTVGIDKKSLDELIALVDRAREQGGWYIFTAHDVSDDSGAYVLAPNVLRKLCAYLQSHTDEIYTGTVREIAQCLPANA